MTEEQKVLLLVKSHTPDELARLVVGMEKSRNEYLDACQTMWTPFLAGKHPSTETPKQVAEFIVNALSNAS